MILDGKMVADLRNEELRKKIIAENLNLTTAIILVGSNPASLVYVKNKIKASKKVGINTKLFNLDESISENELTKVITDLNNDNDIDGILLQLPHRQIIRQDIHLLGSTSQKIKKTGTWFKFLNPTFGYYLIPIDCPGEHCVDRGIGVSVATSHRNCPDSFFKAWGMQNAV